MRIPYSPRLNISHVVPELHPGLHHELPLVAGGEALCLVGDEVLVLVRQMGNDSVQLVADSSIGYVADRFVLRN